MSDDEIGLDEDIEPTADATEGVKGGIALLAGSAAETANPLLELEKQPTAGGLAGGLGGGTK